MKKSVLKEVLKNYTPEKRAKDKTTLYVYYVLRRLSFWITPLFLKCNISANQVSVLAIVTAILAAILIALGNYPILIAGVILMQFWLVLDCADGNIARYRNTFTRSGRFLEDIEDCLVTALLFSSIGIAASKMPGYIPFITKIYSYHFVILGILSSFVVIFRKLIFRNFQIIFWEGKEEKNINFFNTDMLRTIYKMGQNLLGIYSFIHIVILLSAVFNLLGLFTIVYFVINTAGMLFNTFQMIRKAVDSNT